jgi:hypothetical protein
MSCEEVQVERVHYDGDLVKVRDAEQGYEHGEMVDWGS